MINQYILGQPDLIIESDLAGEKPLYFYISENKSILLYSYSINELLNDYRLRKPLEVSSEGISFLLQSGVVPPPKTVYEGIYILGIGDKALVKTLNDKIEISFTHKFPFSNSERIKDNDYKVDEDYLLNIIANATISKLDQLKPTFLFHSAGKDSNIIALALKEAGMQDKVTLVTHKSKGAADESEISKSLAKKMGFNHQVLQEIDILLPNHKKEIEDYFSNAPFPCTDYVSMVYPLYSYQLPELKSANLIFGDGNDSHMISPPDSQQVKMIPWAKWTSRLSFFRQLLNSENYFNPLLRTPAEWFGVFGFSYSDSKRIYSESNSVYEYWKVESRIRENWDLFDFKSDIYSTRVITERMIRKLHNFADAYDSNIVLPFANREIAEFFAKMPEQNLFCRKSLKNKIILRKILKERISLDSDAIGKMGWTYDSSSVVINNWSWMKQEISVCTLWNQKYLNSIVERLKKVMTTNHKYADFSGRLIYRLYLLSVWHNRNKYLRIKS